MSIQCLNWAFTLPLTGAAKAVIIALADRANDVGFCYPSFANIAQRAGCSRMTAIRSVEKLEALGFLEKIKGKGRSNGYFLKLELSTENDQTSNTTIPESGYQQVTPCDQVVTPCDLGSNTMIPKSSRTTKNQKNAREERLEKTSADKTEQADGHLSFKPWQPPQTQRQIDRETGRGELQSIKQFLGARS
ncbi:helix-turn-helix domain-containing protein [Methylotuvimicrobium sp. KM1]|uniref:helix-turn-helix domain-containing protein n=1 Tax=Methylotuvimicrobium sp. KM1 TaxID=3377707 RepID=UPI00384E3E55